MIAPTVVPCHPRAHRVTRPSTVSAPLPSSPCSACPEVCSSSWLPARCLPVVRRGSLRLPPPTRSALAPLCSRASGSALSTGRRCCFSRRAARPSAWRHGLRHVTSRSRLLACARRAARWRRCRRGAALSPPRLRTPGGCGSLSRAPQPRRPSSQSRRRTVGGAAAEAPRPAPPRSASRSRHPRALTPACSGFLPLIAPLRALPRDFRELNEVLAALPSFLHDASETALLRAVKMIPLYRISPGMLTPLEKQLSTSRASSLRGSRGLYDPLPPPPQPRPLAPLPDASSATTASS